MGVGQHLRHLLICITTDTLLDQVNGARNNKGGGGSLGWWVGVGFGGSFETVFPCLQHSHGAGVRRSGLLQPHSCLLAGEMHPLWLLPPQIGQTPHLGLPHP